MANNKSDIPTLASFWQSLDDNLSRSFGVSGDEATRRQMYKALSAVVRDMLLNRRRDFNNGFKASGLKRVHYLSMEFLLGRSLKNNLYNLNLESTAREAVAKHGFSLDELYDEEPDAGLGNGGLGRLAACYMDALATGGYPATGHCLRYEYGLFAQKIIDGWQTEIPDNWLPGGEIWLTPRPDKAVPVRFYGTVTEQLKDGRFTACHTDFSEVESMPYDLIISGAQTPAVSVLRLWSARNKHRFDMTAFTQGEYYKAMRDDSEAEIITKVLYPADETVAGKTLRLKQQYLLVSSAVQDIISDYVKNRSSFITLAQHVAIHINDTHPSLAIAELMRILLDEYALDWDSAWDITTKCCAYTNHTVMAEALETWPIDFFRTLLPRIYDIIHEIDRRNTQSMYATGRVSSETAPRWSILWGERIRMANLAVVGSHNVNGVSALHTQILQRDIFPEYANVTPDKFLNVTNGIAARRWLCQSNPRLTRLLNDKIGTGFVLDMSQLSKFAAFAEDKSVQNELAKIKAANKKNFSDFYFKRCGRLIDPNSRFDVQVKRIHEYKRQLLNVLKIIALYNELLDNPNKAVAPQSFIFGGKAASSYFAAKDVIRLIVKLGEEIEKNKKISEKLSVHFIENYCVTAAEKLIPAAEVSEQISLAGKEASGTGNMKFMINGALTLGTLDGANVEIYEAVGGDNMFLFGMTAFDADMLWRSGYHSMDVYFQNPTLRQVLDSLNAGFSGDEFSSITNYLLSGAVMADPYMCLADFGEYLNAAKALDAAYENKPLWNKMSATNIANAGIFSADRSVKEYCDKIWHMQKFMATDTVK